MYNKKQTNYIPRFILVGLLFQLYPLQDVKCEPTTVATTAVLTAYVPMIVSYASGIVAACLAKTQNWSKGMASIAREMEQRCPSLSTDIQNKRVVTSPTVIPTTAENVASLQQHEQQVVAKAVAKAVSQQDVKRFRAGLRNASSVLSGEIAQRMHDNWQKMSKPQSFQMQTVPGGIRITHTGTGLSFQASMQPSAAATQQVVDWESLVAKLPQANADALKICKYIDEGNIEAAAQIAQLSNSHAVKDLYIDRIEHLFSIWSHDPLVKHLPVQVRHELINNNNALAEFFDCVLARDVIQSALCKAWNIKCNASQVVKDAVYALCDTTKEGQLFCAPELINQRLDEIIHNASSKDRMALVEAFYLPNGVLKDFADHVVVQALKMPKSILSSDNAKDRKILNDLIVAHITANNQGEQLVIMRAIANVKYALSYSIPKKMKEVFLQSAQLVCKSLEHRAQELVNKFMVDAEHYKHLTKPVQVIAQTEVSGAKNILLDKGLTCIARKQFDRAICHEYQLEGMEHAVALIQKDLSNHALQLCYKIITADPHKFAKELPKFTTVVQEDKNHWVVRDMQGNVVQVSHTSIKDPITRKAKRYAKAAIKEFGKLPEIAALNGISQQDLGQQSTILLPSDDTPKGCGHPVPEQKIHTSGCGKPTEEPKIKVPGCGPPPGDNGPSILITPAPEPKLDISGCGPSRPKIELGPCINTPPKEEQKTQLYHAKESYESGNKIVVPEQKVEGKEQSDKKDRSEVLRVDTFAQFLNETKFGKWLKEISEPAVEGGQRGRKIVKKNNHADLDLGDFFYLDKLHKDHIEVFNSRGKFIFVLNLDGTKNVKKTEKALKQGRKL